jgi:hypothetical protein
MKRVAVLGMAVAVVLALMARGAHSADPPTMLEFDTMAAVAGPYVGAANPIRGIPGGGLAWAIDEGRGELRFDGKLEIEVEGLVLAEGANAGSDPIPQFKSIVSCQTIDGTSATPTNISTGLFPATTTGDSKIEATVALPDPCFAPIVFVTSPGGSWFAVTGA